MLWSISSLAQLGLPLTFFFFSSRRRHTRCSRDWSSDVCSSDLTTGRPGIRFGLIDQALAPLEDTLARPQLRPALVDRGCRVAFQCRTCNTHVGDRESVVEGKRVDLGGRRIIKKKKRKN